MSIYEDRRSKMFPSKASKAQTKIIGAKSKWELDKENRLKAQLDKKNLKTLLGRVPDKVTKRVLSITEDTIVFEVTLHTVVCEDAPQLPLDLGDLDFSNCISSGSDK